MNDAAYARGGPPGADPSRRENARTAPREAVAPRIARSAFLAAAAILAHAPACGQAVERNLPPAAAPRQGALAPPPAVATSDDDRPLGADLRGIVLLAPSDPPHRGDAGGVLASPALVEVGAGKALAAFIGRPLSRQLIGRVEASLILAYRRAGFPFVAVATPEQEITGGVLQLRVTEFRLGRLSVAGGAGAPRTVERGIRQGLGDRIDAPALNQDLDWLGRFPFRQIQPVFTPGARPGTTDLRLDVVETRPWRAYGGYANSGTPASGRGRLYLGVLAAPAGIAPDLTGSYQFTAGPDFFVHDGSLFGGGGASRYLSHAARLSFAPGPRQSLSLDVDLIDSRQPVADFIVRQRIFEAGLGHRFALAEIAALPGDLDVGVEARMQERSVSFGGIPVLKAAAEVYQLRLGWAGQWSGAAARAALETALRVNPGGLGGNSDGAALAAYTGGRVRDARYGYGRSRLQGFVRLGRGFGWSSDVSAQFATGPLPDTEQFGIGGQGLVRGYSLDDGAYDGGVVFRNELGGRAFAIDGGVARASVSPFLFADAGLAADRASGRDVKAASIGAGARGQLGLHLSTELAFACALVDGRATRAGTTRLEFRVTLTP